MYVHNQKIGKPNNLKASGPRESKGPKLIAEIGSGYPCLSEKKPSFDNNCNYLKTVKLNNEHTK